MNENRLHWQRIVAHAYPSADPSDVDACAEYLDTRAPDAAVWLGRLAHDDRQFTVWQTCVLEADTWTEAGRRCGFTRDAAKHRLETHHGTLVHELARVLPRRYRARIQLRQAVNRRNVEDVHWHLLDAALDETLNRGDDERPRLTPSLVTKALEKLTQLERDRRLGNTPGLGGTEEKGGATNENSDPQPEPGDGRDEVRAWLDR